MGIERMGPPAWLAERMRARFGIEAFVETGTYIGETTAWAAERFKRVFSVEAHRESHVQALERLGARAHVRLVHGESVAFLREVVPALPGDAMFWLDAHWMGGASHGKESQCPLLEELAEINRSPQAHFLLIDDARLFLAPPPHPNRASQWPTMAEVLEKLGAKPRYTVVCEDVIVSVPERARGEVTAWVQDRVTGAWRRRGQGGLAGLLERAAARLRGRED